MARPSKYTPEVVERITQAISMGATYELAAAYGGISYESFNAWRQGKPQFLQAVKDAEGKAAIGWLEQIEAAANDGTWQAAAWKLERRYPQDYGRTVVDQRHSGQVEHVQLDTAQRLLRVVGGTERSG